MASAFIFVSRSWIDCAVAIGLPRIVPLRTCTMRSKRPTGRLPTRVAAMWPAATRVKRC